MDSTHKSIQHLQGAWLINKPAGITSFGVIEEIRRALIACSGLKKRDLPALGHGGTLDPFATGLLVLFVGRATKLSQCYLGGTKTYCGRIRFGATTASGDLTDSIIQETATLPQDRASVQAVANTFLGEPYAQVPPMHSAKKIDGKRLYELAHKGQSVERAPRNCTILRFEITSFDVNTCNFEVSVSAGTYIRVLAQDLAVRLGSLGFLEALSRTQSSSLTLESAIPLEELTNALRKGSSPVERGWVPWDSLLNNVDTVNATAQEIKELFEGRQRALIGLAPRVIKNPRLDDVKETHWVAIRSEGKLYGLGRLEGTVLQLDRLFPHSVPDYSGTDYSGTE